MRGLTSTRALPALLVVLMAALLAAAGLSGLRFAKGGQAENGPGVLGRLAPPPPDQSVSPSVKLVSLERWPGGNPAFSPDGSLFFTLGEQGLQVGPADGITSARNLEPDAVEARWTADSNSLAVVVANGGLASENQRAPVEIVAADGSSRRRVAVTDLPRKIQTLPGKLAYVADSRLHLLDLATNADQDTGIIIDTDATNDLPYQVSPDGRFVAVLAGTTLGVVDLVSGDAKQLTSAIDGRRWAPYAWSADGRSLAYAEVQPSGRSRIIVYDVIGDLNTGIVESAQAGFYAGLKWTPSGGWLLYAFHPRGNRVEEEASYEAVNVYSGERSVLFQGGLGLRLSADGHRIVFTRASDPQERGVWVATIAF